MKLLVYCVDIFVDDDFYIHFGDSLSISLFNNICVN